MVGYCAHLCQDKFLPCPLWQSGPVEFLAGFSTPCMCYKQIFPVPVALGFPAGFPWHKPAWSAAQTGSTQRMSSAGVALSPRSAAGAVPRDRAKDVSRVCSQCTERGGIGLWKKTPFLEIEKQLQGVTCPCFVPSLWCRKWEIPNDLGWSVHL